MRCRPAAALMLLGRSAAGGGSGACTSASDCALNGDCVGGACRCDAAWAGSPACDVLSFAPAPRDAAGYRNKTQATWGGMPVRDGGAWHLVHAHMLNGCGLVSWKRNPALGSWKRNSAVARAVSSGGPAGPYTYAEQLLPNFAHNPTIRKIGDDFVIWYIGGWAEKAAKCGAGATNHTLPAAGGGAGGGGGCSCWRNQTASGSWPKTCGEDMPGPSGDCCGGGVGLNGGCGIAIAHSKSLSGPWQSAPLKIVDQWRSQRLYCAHTNPAPAVLPNGTVLMAFNAGFCDGRLETIGVATAPHWSGPYTLLSPEPILEPGGKWGPHKSEDPFLWSSPRGWHLLVHNQQGPQGVSAYAHSVDARNWTLSPNTPYKNCNVTYTDGGTEQFGHCERPQLLFPVPGAAPSHLVNGAGASTGLSFTLIRPVKQP